MAFDLWLWSEPRQFLHEWVESVTCEETDHEANSVHRRADHWDFAGGGNGCCDDRYLLQTRNLQRNVLQMEGQVRWSGVSDAKRLRALEDENAKLKKLLAEAMLDNPMLKDVASKKW